MSGEETQTRAGGGRTARSFTAREDLVQALVSLGVTQNAATRVLQQFIRWLLLMWQL